MSEATQPSDVYISHEGDGSWSSTVDLGRLRGAFGDDLVTAFCCAFVQADRLSCLGHFALLMVGRTGPVATRRNAEAITFFTLGTLLELSHAIEDLRLALRNRQWLDVRDFGLLSDFEKKWRNSRWLNDARAQAAFHVQPALIRRGLQALDQGRRDLARGDEEANVGSSFRLAAEALTAGAGTIGDLAEPERGFEVLLTKVLEDRSIDQVLLAVFARCLGRAGLSYSEVSPSAG